MRDTAQASPTNQNIILVAFLCLFACVSSCIPFASPPLKLSLKGGVAVGEIASEGEDNVREITSSEIMQVRGELKPLDLFPSLFERNYDFGLGYQGELYELYSRKRMFTKHGPYLSVSYFPWVWKYSEKDKVSLFLNPSPTPACSFLRFGLHASGDLMLGDIGSGIEVGGGATFGISFEIVYLYNGRFLETGYNGWAYGKSVIGVNISTGYRYIHDRHYATVIFGLIMRTPASVGLLFSTEKKMKDE